MGCDMSTDNADVEIKFTTLPKYCPICGAVLSQQDETVDGVIIKVWVCDDCGFETPV